MAFGARGRRKKTCMIGLANVRKRYSKIWWRKMPDLLLTGLLRNLDGIIYIFPMPVPGRIALF